MNIKTNPGSPAPKRRVFVVDDHPIVRQGLALLVNQTDDLAVCGDAGDAPTALEAIAASRPDILVLDISLQGPDGIDLLKQIRARLPELPVLMLSMHSEAIYAERALRAGANGYIMKQEATEDVLVAIRRILRGEVYVSNHVASRMLRRVAGAAEAQQVSPLSTLSDRELEVFRLVGKGYGTRQIANELKISVKTVESYHSHLKDKLSLRNARELVQYAIEWAIGEQEI